MEIDWPEDEWRAVLQTVERFTLDATFEAPSHVWNWLLPRTSSDERLVTPPALPVTRGRVFSADAFGREEALARFYGQFPKPPPPGLRREHAWACCFAVDLVLTPEGGEAIDVDMFGAGILDADAVLGLLADLNGPPGVVYDNLDQGWAVRIMIEAEWVVWLEWDWEDEGPGRRAQALAMRRSTMAEQAAAARSRMDHVHRYLVGSFGLDLWHSGRGER